MTGLRKRLFAVLLGVMLCVGMLPSAVYAAEGEAVGSDAASVYASASSSVNIAIGDYIQMGTYYGQPILWRCVDIDGNGALMLSDKILCLKAYDALPSLNTETGSHSRRSYASNYWGDSNIRSWLNSTAEAGEVVWLCGNPPDEADVWLGSNDYDGEAGFLSSSNFTTKELALMKEVTQKSIIAKPEYYDDIYTMGTELYDNDKTRLVAESLKNYDNAYAEEVTDKMFLLDEKQAYTMWKNRYILGDDYYIGRPTEECIANNEYVDDNGELKAGEPWYSRLRSPQTDRKDDVRCIGPDGYIYGHDADMGSDGIRPAFYLNTSVAIYTSGSGTETDPYLISTIEIGDYIQVGTYYGQPILWRCVDIDENGFLMLSDKVLTIKPFDVQQPLGAEGAPTGSHARDRLVNYKAYWTGELLPQYYSESNYWADSNIRSWLNSTASAGNVVWLCGNPPDETNNSYADEAGFLSSTNFTTTETSLFKEVTQKSILSNPEIYANMATMGNQNCQEQVFISDIKNYDTAYAENVTDKVFLLDTKQINAVYNNSDILGEEYYIGKVTEECSEHNYYKPNEYLGLEPGEECVTWLRTADSVSDSFVEVIHEWGYTKYYSAESDYVGVRPAFYLNTENIIFESGAGTEESPFVVDGGLSTGLIPIVESASAGGIDLLSEKLSVLKGSTDKYEILTKIGLAGCTDVHVYITQGEGASVELPLDGSLEIEPGQVFDAGKPVYILAIDKVTGNSTVKCTKMSIERSGTFDYLNSILDRTYAQNQNIICTALVNNTDADKDCTLYTAVFDSSGTIKDSVTENMTIPANVSGSVDTVLSCDLTNGDTVMTFLWDDNMQPIADSSTYVIEQTEVTDDGTEE